MKPGIFSFTMIFRKTRDQALLAQRVLSLTFAALFCLGGAAPVAAATVTQLQGQLKPDEEVLAYLENCGAQGYSALLAAALTPGAVADTARLVLKPADGQTQSIPLQENFDSLTCQGNFLLLLGESGSAMNVQIFDLHGLQPVVALHEGARAAPVFLRRGQQIFVALAKEMHMSARQPYMEPAQGNIYQFNRDTGHFQFVKSTRWARLGRYGAY